MDKRHIGKSFINEVSEQIINTTDTNEFNEDPIIS